MSLSVKNRSQTGGLSLPQEELTAHRQSLALNALSKLAAQFADKPEFGRLVEVLVLTLSGQFSTPNAFALVRKPGSHLEESRFFGTGKLRDNKMLSMLDFTHEHRDYFLENSSPLLVERFDMSDHNAKLGFCLSECEVVVVAPLLHGKRLIGIIGLGEKATRKPFEAEDMELLTAMVASVSPFMANSFLFEEIAEQGRWYLEILNGVRQGVFVFDRLHQLTKINRAGYRILRAFKPKLPGPEALSHVTIDRIFRDLTFPGWSTRLSEARKRRDRERIKNMVATKGGYKRIFSVGVTVIESSSFEDGGFIVTLDDVTDALENERRMFDLERFADKGVMASSIAHELNNFLGLILGGVELAELRLAESKPDKAAGTLEKIKSNIGKMTRFTTGLMDYGKLNTSKALADLNASISDVLSFVAVQQKFGGIAIKTELAPDLPEFEVDTDQIAQLLLNLLSNAADAIHQSDSESGQITITTSVSEDSINLSVSDNGCGIEENVKARLFKAHLTTKECGHGYGLVTCAKILKNHNAEVEIVSECGQGTAFSFRFPLNPPGEEMTSSEPD